MKECELCDSPARMFCESDQASLCWDCDLKVHSANFLVARHTRNLLCHGCQALTPWKASGTKLGPTVSVCEKCFSSRNGKEGNRVEEQEEDDGDGGGGGGEDDEDEEENESEGANDDEDDDDEIDGEDETDEDDDENGDDEEDGDNQVVPWSSTPPPPVLSYSSSSEDSSSSSRFCNGGGGGRVRRASSTALPLKRTRDEKLDLNPQDDDLGCSTSEPNSETIHQTAEEEASSFVSYRRSKDRRIAMEIQSPTNLTQSASSSAAAAASSIITSLERFERNLLTGTDSSASIVGFRKLSKDPSAL